MRVAIITESFPPDVNGVANSVLRSAAHLFAPWPPAAGRRSTAVHRHARVPEPLPYPVVRVASVPLPGYPAFRLGLPGRQITAAVRDHGADVVHLASPFVLGAWGAASARRLGLPVVAVYQTDVPGYARAYHLGRSEEFAWPGVRLVIVGAGPAEPALRRALPSAAFVGERHGSQLSRLLASLDIFVHTGPLETFCQSIQEAMASGVPVVAPAAGGPLDLVRPGRTGLLVPPLDGAALAEAVGILAADEGLRQSCGLAARAEVEQRTWTAIGDELIDHYLAVTGARHPTGDIDAGCPT